MCGRFVSANFETVKSVFVFISGWAVLFSILLSAGSLLLKKGGWKRRNLSQIFGNSQGSGMLVQVLKNRKFKIYKLFAGQAVLHVQLWAKNLPNKAST